MTSLGGAVVMCVSCLICLRSIRASLCSSISCFVFVSLTQGMPAEGCSENKCLEMIDRFWYACARLLATSAKSNTSTLCLCICVRSTWAPSATMVAGVGDYDASLGGAPWAATQTRRVGMTTGKVVPSSKSCSIGQGWSSSGNTRRWTGD